MVACDILHGKEERVSAQPMESRMSRLEGAYEQVDRRLDSMDHRFESLQHEMHEGFRLLDGKIDQRFMWTMGGIATSWATTMLAIVFHH